ncbi:class I SAM-dependent methyltransferase [Alteromonas oceanisediminis]|uniref:class I SAM-dependent methyltransferase n=1 Tax=Alteromonas oceanisediminis TaxID=2836180 RepID=UPI002023AF48|nr:methyltransferase [Alteromonas oceanisediminis]
MKKLHTLLFASTLSLAFASSTALAHEEGHNTDEALKIAMASDIRSEDERTRDANRRPVETLTFFGLEPEMKIVELLPGGGWYTKLLVPVVAEHGEYYAAIGTGRIKEQLAGQPGFEKMNIVAEDAKLWREEGSRFYSMELGSLGVTDADMVLTFRNYHNFGEQGRAAMNKAAFDALKSGGIYAVVDHTARHMEPMTDSNRRRFDPVKAIKEIQDAGFELVDFTDIHYREDDELEYEVGAKSVTGNTDRWTLKFVKP